MSLYIYKSEGVYVLQWYEKVNNDDLKKQLESIDQQNFTHDDEVIIEPLGLEHQPIIADHQDHIRNSTDLNYQIEYMIDDMDQQQIQNICNDPNVDRYSEMQIHAITNDEFNVDNIIDDNIFYAAFDDTTSSETQNNSRLHSEVSVEEQATELNYGERVKALYIQWLELLLHDQTALSQLLHAEAIHIQAFLSEESRFSTHPTRQDIVAFQETVGKVIDSLNEKQRIQIKLLDSSIKLFQQGERVE